MKCTFSITCLLFACSFMAHSQDDKKEWAKKLKETDPMAFKAIVQERDQLKTEIDELKKHLEDTKANSVKMPAEHDETDVSAQGFDRQGHTGKAGGVVFKVQIGAFKNKDLTKYFENNKNFSGDVDSDGTKKYTLGYFSDYWEADKFKKYLREMGVKDAWIVPYKDGKRQNIKDVLEGASE